MRLRPLQSLAFAVLLGLLLAPQTGCTALFAIVGDSADSAGAPRRTVPAGKAATIPHGRHVIVVLQDGTRVEGAFRDTVRLPDASYESLWQRWLANDDHVPSVVPGDPVTVADDSGEWSGVFRGYHYRSIEVTTADGTLRRVPMASIRALSGPGGFRRTGEDLRALDAASALPSRMGIALAINDAMHGISSIGMRERVVSISDIRVLGLDHGHAGRNTGIVLGLAADVVVVTTVAQASTSAFACQDADWGDIHLFGARSEGIELTHQPYDCVAGGFVPDVGGSGSALRAAPAR
jgi:hypothetical protein